MGNVLLAINACSANSETKDEREGLHKEALSFVPLIVRAASNISMEYQLAQTNTLITFTMDTHGFCSGRGTFPLKNCSCIRHPVQCIINISVPPRWKIDENYPPPSGHRYFSAIVVFPWWRFLADIGNRSAIPPVRLRSTSLCNCRLPLAFDCVWLTYGGAKSGLAIGKYRFICRIITLQFILSGERIPGERELIVCQLCPCCKHIANIMYLALFTPKSTAY